jgi:hypothetical protein
VVDGLKKAANSIKLGRGLDLTTQMGPLYVASSLFPYFSLFLLAYFFLSFLSFPLSLFIFLSLFLSFCCFFFFEPCY